MDGSKFIEIIGFFGILGLFFAFFLSFTLCTCLIVHVRYIWTYLCPLKSVGNCFRSFCRKFSSSHKRVPQTLHELEELVSNTQSAKKLDRKVNQAESLREFADITPRMVTLSSNYANREFSGKRGVLNLRIKKWKFWKRNQVRARFLFGRTQQLLVGPKNSLPIRIRKTRGGKSSPDHLKLLQVIVHLKSAGA